MFTILTAARPGEVQKATWDEIDLDGACWQLSPDKTKGGKFHRVPLERARTGDPAATDWLDRREGEELVFPGPLWSRDMLSEAFPIHQRDRSM